MVSRSLSGTYIVRLALSKSHLIASSHTDSLMGMGVNSRVIDFPHHWASGHKGFLLGAYKSYV